MTETQINALPRELRELKQWTFWKKLSRPNGVTKPPCDKSGYSHDCTLEKNLLKFEPALKAFLAVKEKGKVSGIGFAFNENGISGIDIDHCIDQAGNLTEAARKIIDRVDSYTEISPSKTGIHILVKGTLPEKYRNLPSKGKIKGTLGGKSGAFEAYSSGRYFTMTGNVFEGKAKIEERQTELVWFWEVFVKAKQAISQGGERETAVIPTPSEVLESLKKPVTENRGSPSVLTVEEILAIAERSRLGESFKKLMLGDLSEQGGDESKADYALMKHLAFFCGKDPVLMEQVFNRSGLATRDKWKRTDYRQRTIEAAIKATKNTYSPTSKRADNQETPEDWETPVCPDSKSVLPAFPVDALPKVIQDHVESVAARTQCPPDLPAFAALGVLAAAGAKKYRVQIGVTHEEPLNLYLLCALPPGSRKSEVFSLMASPLHEEESRLLKLMNPEIDRARLLCDIAKKKVARLKTDAASDKNTKTDEEIIEEIEEIKENAKIPHYPCLIKGGDITPEAVACQLDNQGGKLALFDTEGGLFAIMAGRYDSNGESNLDVWLKGHSGKDVLSVTRKNSAPIEVHNPALTVALSIQPDVIRNLSGRKDFKGRGLLGRFLYSIPDSLIGTRFYKAIDSDNAAKERYSTAISNLLKQPGKRTQEEEKDPHIKINLTGKALEVWERFYNDVESRQTHDKDLAGMTDWASKLPGAVARIAAGFHLLETNGNPENISTQDMERACKIGSYLIDHAKAAYGLMKATREKDMAHSILAWIGSSPKEILTASEFWTAHRSLAEEINETIPSFEYLARRGILRGLPSENTGRGRKAKWKYQVNPKCLSCRKCFSGEI